MGTEGNQLLSARGFWVFAVSLLFVSACGWNIPRFGTGGRYLEGKDQFLRGRGGDMNKAIDALEYVVRQEPTYRDSLTLLARAYYNKGRYKDAHEMLRFALGVNKDDEIAWVVLGLTQMRLGENENGLETLKGGITLLSRVAVTGYRNFPEWDVKGGVRSSIGRVAFLATKGLEEKQGLVNATETLLARMDDEENFQRLNAEKRRTYDYSR